MNLFWIAHVSLYWQCTIVCKFWRNSDTYFTPLIRNSSALPGLEPKRARTEESFIARINMESRAFRKNGTRSRYSISRRGARAVPYELLQKSRARARQRLSPRTPFFVNFQSIHVYNSNSLNAWSALSDKSFGFISISLAGCCDK